MRRQLFAAFLLAVLAFKATAVRTQDSEDAATPPAQLFFETNFIYIASFTVHA